MKIAQFILRGVYLILILFGANWACAGTGGINGPDEFEPDDVPMKARFLALEDEGNSFRTIYKRNFDRPNDVDWAYFRVSDPLFIFVRTTGLFSKADTFLSLYKLVNSNTPQGEAPPECREERIRLTADFDLLAIACNDDISEGFPESEISIDIDTPGTYFVRVTNSPRFFQKGTAPSGPETTYGLEATYFGIVPGGIVASVYDSITFDPITTAIVREPGFGIIVSANTNGVYNLGALAAGGYNLRVEVPGYETQEQSVLVADGNFKNVDFPMVPIVPRHSLDYSDPANDLSLAELLRAIQFYNIGEFGCDPTTEDNYSPGLGSHGCARHSADYAPFDWRLNLSEILRLIQLYNAPNGFEPCEGGEDGFCPKF